MAMERMQILVTPVQRRGLKAVATAKGTSVTEEVRRAIEAHIAATPLRAERRQALAELRALPRVPFIAPEELRDILDARIDEEVDLAGFRDPSPLGR